jgi:hypothetical protein
MSALSESSRRVAGMRLAFRFRFPRLLVASVLALPLLLLAHATSSAQWLNWAPPTTVLIPETGQTIDGYFLDVWRAWGGASSFGNPITPEFTENGRTVQYYEYARFEYVPDDPDGNVVHFGEIGKELRPLTVFRASPLIADRGTGANPASSLARELRAWLPLSENAASKPNTATWRYVPETQHSVQGSFKDFWEATGEDSYLGFPLTEEYDEDGVRYQIFERGKLAWTADQGVYMVKVGSVLARQYRLDTNPGAVGDIPIYSEDLFVPPPQVGGEHWIDINLSAQYLVAYDGTIPVAETYVSTGREGFETPTGTFYINSKIESQTMEGVLGGEYYNVPDVPWVMYFTDLGHALHGTYWHNNFGAVMSHGCVNLPMDFAEWLYSWADYGTRVEIHY